MANIPQSIGRQLKNRAVKICDARYTFNKVLGYVPIVTKE